MRCDGYQLLTAPSGVAQDIMCCSCCNWCMSSLTGSTTKRLQGELTSVLKSWPTGLLAVLNGQLQHQSASHHTYVSSIIQFMQSAVHAQPVYDELRHIVDRYNTNARQPGTSDTPVGDGVVLQHHAHERGPRWQGQTLLRAVTTVHAWCRSQYLRQLRLQLGNI